MSRQPQRRQVNATVALFAKAERAAGKDSLPSDPDVLRTILNGLVKRIEERSLREAQLIRTRIQTIAGLEALEDLDPYIRVVMVATCLSSIADEKPSKREHNPETVQLQWHLLLRYFGKHDLGEIGSMPDSKQLKELTQQLSRIPCLCPYRPIQNGLRSLQQWIERQNKKRKKPIENVRAHLGYHLLAELHNRTGPQNIRKLLSYKLRIKTGGTLDTAAKRLHVLVPVLQSAWVQATKQLSNGFRPSS